MSRRKIASHVVIGLGCKDVGRGSRGAGTTLLSMLDAFSRAVLGEAPLEFPIEDAIANMRVIDAAFRSARSGDWEKP